MHQVAMPSPWWAARLSALCGIGEGEALRLTPLFEDPSCWLLSEVAGVRVIRLPMATGGQAVSALGLRAAAGTVLPSHRHPGGNEHVLVLEGMLREPSGRIATAGDELFSARGSEHALTVVGDSDCVCCVVVLR